MKQVASLHYGVIFKKAFCVPEIFTGFVRDLLNIELEIDTVETEKSFPYQVGRVASRFDLFAEDKQNRIIVDIQHARYRDHYDRFLHYHCIALLEQILNADNYRPNLKVFTIVVLTSGDWHKKDVSVIDFDPKDLKGHPLGEIPHKIIYICPKYTGEETPKPYQEWMQAIQDSLDEQVNEDDYQVAEVRQLFDYIEKDKVSPEERAQMFEQYNEEQLKQDKFEEGLKKGRKEGIKEGADQNAQKIAKEMLRKGMDIGLISELTELSQEAITQLQD
jgi:predicted transposase/invertase (TIGR01784 family)